MNEVEIILEYQSLKTFTDEVGLQIKFISDVPFPISVWRGENRLGELPNLAALRLFLAGYGARGEA